MALNKNTLKAAVKRYMPLVGEKSEQEIKEAIAADEKGFDEECVNEIFAALSGTAGEDKPVYTVVKEFRDINDFSKVYFEGSDVSHFSKERLEHLESIGHVTKE